MMGIVAAGADPKNFGFDISLNTVALKKIKTFIIWSEPHDISLDYLWTPIKDKIKSNRRILKESGIYKDLKWFCEEMQVKIVNSTRGGNLEVYQRLSLEDALTNFN